MPNVSLVFRFRSSVNFKRRFLYFFCCCSVVFVGGGCSTYQNVTGYFNTYYNANKLFDETVGEVELASQKARDSLYVVEYKVSPAQAQKFDKVIEKSSKLIQFYDKSGWVDDAILMIGISYVYKGENESAERKFRELLDNFPESDLRRQAKLWYAKSEYFMGKSESALKFTTELFDEARSEGDNEVLFDMLMLEAQIAGERGEFDVAAQKYTLASEISVDDQLRARAQNQLALTHERLGDWQKAADAYRDVSKFNPPFPLEFQSRLKYGRMLALSQQYDRALTVLDDLFEEQLKLDERSLVDLELANTHWARGDSVNAFALYNLIDTVYARSDASAKAHYKRGLICEQNLHDFKSAKDYYTKAREQYAQSEVAPLSQKKMTIFNNYFRHYDDIRKYDSLYALRLHLDSLKVKSDSVKAFQDSLGRASFTSSLHADSISSRNGARADRLNLPEGKAKFAASLHADSVASSQPEHPLAAVPDSVSQTLADAPDENLDEDEEEPEESHRRIGEKSAAGRIPADSLIRNRSALGKKNAAMKSKLGAADTSKTKQAPVQVAPSVALAPDSIKALLARTKFELGAVLFLELQLPDSALFWFHRVVREHPSSRMIPRTLYTMAEIYRSSNENSVVDSLYKVLIDGYGNSEYGMQAKRILGMSADSTHEDIALQEYQAAARHLDEHNTTEAIQSLKEIIKQHSGSPYKPKSMYMIGWIYENAAVENDSAAAWYGRLVKEYPSSIYAAEVQAKLAVKSDPKTLPQYIKYKEIPSVQPPKADRSATTSSQPQQKDKEDEELMQGRRNRDRDPDEEEEEEEPEEDVDEDNNLPL